MSLVTSLVAAAFLFAALAGAQTLENTGKPMRVIASCTGEDIGALGLSCPPHEPCPIFLELASIEAIGAKLFAAGNLHTASTTISSILLTSDDGGKTWTEPHPRIPAAGLDQIQFIDFETGWISGQTLGSLSRDPFFLTTSDGGKTWGQHPIFEEGRIAAIEQFWFESRTSGSLLVDHMQADDSGARHELYESMTGGESWNLLQVSAKTIPLKHAPSKSDSGWRLRADAPSKSYRVERRHGEGWQTVASFLIQVGECKMEEFKEPVEPPVIVTPLDSGVKVTYHTVNGSRFRPRRVHSSTLRVLYRRKSPGLAEPLFADASALAPVRKCALFERRRFTMSRSGADSTARRCQPIPPSVDRI